MYPRACSRIDGGRVKTLSEAAALLGVESGTLRRQVRLGKLKATKIGPIWIVDDEEIERYRAEHRREK